MTHGRDLVDLVVLGALWGAAFLFMRVAAPAFGPVALVAVRVAIAAAVLLPFMWRAHGLTQARAAARPLFLVGAISTAIPFTLFAYAALSLPAGVSSVLNASVPLFGTLIGFVWLRRRPAPIRLVGLAIGFAGVLVLAWPRLTSGGDWLAVVAALSGTVLYALAALVTQRTLTGVPPLVIAAGSQASAAMLLLPLAPWWWPPTPPVPTAWFTAAALGILCTAVAFAIYFRLLARVGPTTAMTVTYLVPVFGVSWGAMFLGERLNAGALVGGGLVLAGVAVATWAPPQPSR